MTAHGLVSTAVAVDTGAASLGAVEHLVHDLDGALADLPDALVVSTHVVSTPVPRFVAVLGWESQDPADVVARVLEGLTGLAEVPTTRGPVLVARPDFAEGADRAVAEHLSRRSGRLAHYPGRAAIERRLSAAEVVAHSCVDVVEGLAGAVVEPDSPLDLTGFARPTWREGRCTLLVQRAVGGVLVPFEAREQQACCDNH